MKILGLEFRRMTHRDYIGLEGVEPGSYIAETEATLVWNPATKILSEIYVDENDVARQRDWKGEIFVCG